LRGITGSGPYRERRVVETPVVVEQGLTAQMFRATNYTILEVVDPSRAGRDHQIPLARERSYAMTTAPGHSETIVINGMT
jgi:hypothetical protein